MIYYDFTRLEGMYLPKISVIVPVYKAENYLEKCVRSVLEQDFADWELILVDDGSPDSSPALCDRFAAEDSRIRVLHQENGGVSVARNNGMAAATGDWLAFLDSDDWMEAHALSTLYTALTESGANCAVCGHWLAYDNGSAVEEHPPLPDGVYPAEVVRQSFSVPLLCDRLREGAVNGYVWRCLLSRRTIEQAGIRFSGAYLEDELFLIEYFACDVTAAVVDKPLYYYYQNPLSVTKRYLKDFCATFFASLALKDRLVEQYAIPVTPDWRDNTCWAGLLMAVGNEFAASNPAPRSQRLHNVKAMCAIPEFAHALKHYIPQGMGKKKALVAQLLRKKQFTLLAALYAVKNRG